MFLNQPFSCLEPTDFYSDGPVMANLKIVELAGSSRDEDCHACCSSFLFMDSCPALQSAHIKIDCSRIVINYSVKNANLQDLVIQNVSMILLELQQFFLIVILINRIVF